MSGGAYDYVNDRACTEIFGWMMHPNYGEDGFSKANIARKINPFEDKQLSELCWDMFCLLHSLDWYKSADTCEETYRKDVEYFKKKWLFRGTAKIQKDEIDKSVEELRAELYTELLLD